MPVVRKLDPLSVMPAIQVYSGDSKLNTGTQAPNNIRKLINYIVEWIIVLPSDLRDVSFTNAMVDYLIACAYAPKLLTLDSGETIIALPVKKG